MTLQSFSALRQKLNGAPVLAYPNFEWEFTVDCDASLRAVLSNNHKGNERVISYASRTLSKAEEQYCATRREMLCGPFNNFANISVAESLQCALTIMH